MVGIVWNIDYGDCLKNEIVWTIGPGGGHLIKTAWTTEPDAFLLVGIGGHNRQSIAIGNY